MRPSVHGDGDQAAEAAQEHHAGDPTIQAIITGELAVLRQRILDVSGLDGHDRAVLASVLTGWLVFVRVLVLDWLDTGEMSQDELETICMGALFGAAPQLNR